MVEKQEPFIIELRHIATDPVSGSLISIFVVSLDGNSMRTEDAMAFCSAMQSDLCSHEPWQERLIACGLEKDANSIMVVLFGAWIPIDFTSPVRRVLEAIRNGHSEDGEPVKVTEELRRIVGGGTSGMETSSSEY